ncbi:MAG: tRNA pseudouridine(38-40) synthase TruA [Parvularculales bacterium]
MARYKLTIEYDGSAFCGWQSQANGGAVQDALTNAIEAFCGERVVVYGAGRTDAGVHALGQTAHIDLTRRHNPDVIREAVNFHSRPLPVSVLSVTPTADDFDARFSARRRDYRYRIINRRARLSVELGQAWHVSTPLDINVMNSAAQCLVGQHDFTTFRSSCCQARSPVKTLDAITVQQTNDSIVIECQARSFLHHQVRSMVGSLKMVGSGKWPEATLAQALKVQDRTACGPVAPAEGLYLVAVSYGDVSAPAK